MEIHKPLAEEATGAQTAKDKRYHKISEEKGDRHQVQQAVPPTTHWLRQMEIRREKITSCSCAVMETPNINQTSQEALLQQCLADLDMNIRDLDAEPKERDLLVTTWEGCQELELVFNAVQRIRGKKIQQRKRRR